jgi:hypothetical protein
VTEPTRERIAERVRRLLALSKSPNEHEAAAAAQKAQELLLKHDLSMAEVDVAEAPEVVEGSTKLANGAGWRITLLFRVAEAYGCEMTYSTGTGGRCQLYGRAHAIEVVLHVNEYLARTIERLAEEAARNISFWDTGESRKWRTRFRYGAVRTVTTRLKESRRTLAQESAQTQALVLVNDKAVKEFFQRLYPPGTLGRSSLGSDMGGHGYRAGREAGHGIALNDAVRGPSGSRAPQLSGGSR